MKFRIDKKGYNVQEVDAYLKKLADDYTRVVDGLRLRVDDLTAALNDRDRRIKEYKEKTGIVAKAIMNAVAKAEEIKHRAKYQYDQEIARLKAFHERWISHYNRILEQYPIDEDLIALGEFNREMSRILTRAANGQDEAFSQELQENFESEQRRAKEKRIGYITVQTNGSDDEDDDGDDYDPVARIQSYLASDKEKPQVTAKPPKAAAAPKQKAETAVASDKNKPSKDYSDRSESGYSFEEALNPTDDLEQIMRDLGLLLEE